MSRKFTIVLGIIFAFLCVPSCLVAQSLKIGVISDLHYMAPSLLVEKGTAFENKMRTDRKLLEESPAILKAAVEQLIKEQVGLVLIPGDLTKDGELASHEGVVELLKPLLDKGIKVLVVPGNHDINNPHAVSFRGNATTPVPTVTAAEFREIYSDFGFKTALLNDSQSLSYISEPVEGLRILCIDDCDYDHNLFISKGDSQDFCSGKGLIKPETRQWMQQQIEEARAQGKQVLAIMHHNVVEHFDYESAFPDYMTENGTEVQKAFMKAGLTTIFTGHFHAMDIARADDKSGNHLYDIETGSLVTYPCSYRILELSGDSMKIESRQLGKIESTLQDHIDFQAYAHNEAAKRMSNLVLGLVDQYYQQLSTSVPKYATSFVTIPDKNELKRMVSTHILSDCTDLILAHYHGNENLSDSAQYKRDKFLADIDDLIHDFARESSGMLYPVTEKAIENADVTKRIKDIVISIWDDKTGPDYPKKDYPGQPNEVVNDLNLVIALSKKL